MTWPGSAARGSRPAAAARLRGGPQHQLGLKRRRPEGGGEAFARVAASTVTDRIGKLARRGRPRSASAARSRRQ
eukprot:8784925-Pyramimonas_sp.AAC.1